MKYYLAYGSNLSVEDMLRRCPGAIYVGYGFLKDRRLMFRRGFLTVGQKRDCVVPVLVWRVNEADEAALDRYEGYPHLYRKEEVPMKVLSFIDGKFLGTVTAFVYVMDASGPGVRPSRAYLDICTEGYKRFGFNLSFLKAALEEFTPQKR